MRTRWGEGSQNPYISRTSYMYMAMAPNGFDSSAHGDSHSEGGEGSFVRGGFGRVSSCRRNGGGGGGGGEKYNLVEECTVPSPTMQRSRRSKRQSR